jgi:phosphoenolpyruvate synthase/pyruvate phosphate dikinase
MTQLPFEHHVRTAEARFEHFIIDLSDAQKNMLPVVGGKAVNLGELIRAGLPVPGGFCITTEAYAQPANSVSIDFDALENAGPEQLRQLAAQAREALLAASIPRSVALAVVGRTVGLELTSQSQCARRPQPRISHTQVLPANRIRS